MIDEDGEVLFDDAVVMGETEEPYDIEACVDSLHAALLAIVTATDPKNKSQTCARAREVLLLADVALMQANGLSEDEAGEAFVTAWRDYETDAGSTN